VLLSHVGASYRNFLEIVMFAFLLEYLGRPFEHAEQRRKDEYLAGARDLAELERRIRSLERDGYPRRRGGFSLIFLGTR
jgi:hypothetical protein